MKIVLASASPRRSELLKQVGVRFEVVPSDVEEKINTELNPQTMAKDLALLKAMDVAVNAGKGSLVIGADTIVSSEYMLGKPEDEKAAYKMLKSLSGKWHEVITGVAVVDSGTLRSKTQCEVTRVKMRELTDEMINAYIKTGEPMDKAGAYGIQGFGALLVERIEGCYFNVVGLPLTLLSTMLEEFGIRILA